MEVTDSEGSVSLNQTNIDDSRGGITVYPLNEMFENKLVNYHLVYLSVIYHASWL